MRREASDVERLAWLLAWVLPAIRRHDDVLRLELHRQAEVAPALFQHVAAEVVLGDCLHDAATDRCALIVGARSDRDVPTVENLLDGSLGVAWVVRVIDEDPVEALTDDVGLEAARDAGPACCVREVGDRCGVVADLP